MNVIYLFISLQLACLAWVCIDWLLTEELDDL